MKQYHYANELKEIYQHYLAGLQSFLQENRYSDESNYWKRLYTETKESIFLSTGKCALQKGQWIEFLISSLPIVCLYELTAEMNNHSLTQAISRLSVSDQSILNIPQFEYVNHKLCLLTVEHKLSSLDADSIASLMTQLDKNVSLSMIKEVTGSFQIFAKSYDCREAFAMLSYPILSINGATPSSTDDGQHFSGMLTFQNASLECPQMACNALSGTVDLLKQNDYTIDLSKSKGLNEESKQMIQQVFTYIANYLDLDHLQYDEHKDYLFQLPPQFANHISMETDMDDFFDEYFNTMANYDEKRAYRIKQIMLATVLQLQSLRKAIFFYGPAGTGKSTLLKIFESLYAPQDVKHITLDEFGHDDAIIGIRGAQLITGSDNPDSLVITAKESNRFRKLISGEDVSAFEKYKERAHFVNYSIMLQAMNDLPTVEFVKSATNFLDRIAVVKIETRIRHTKNQIESFEKYFTNRNASAKLIGYLFRNVGYFTQLIDHEDDEAILKKVKRSDSLQEFVDECVKDGLLLNQALPLNLLRDGYFMWMKANYQNSKPLGKIKVNERLDATLTKLGYQLSDKRSRIQTLNNLGVFNAQAGQFDKLLGDRLDKIETMLTTIYCKNNVDLQSPQAIKEDIKQVIEQVKPHEKLDYIVLALTQVLQSSGDAQLAALITMYEETGGTNDSINQQLKDYYDSHFA